MKPQQATHGAAQHGETADAVSTKKPPPLSGADGKTDAGPVPVPAPEPKAPRVSVFDRLGEKVPPAPTSSVVARANAANLTPARPPAGLKPSPGGGKGGGGGSGHAVSASVARVSVLAAGRLGEKETPDGTGNVGAGGNFAESASTVRQVARTVAPNAVGSGPATAAPAPVAASGKPRVSVFDGRLGNKIPQTPMVSPAPAAADPIAGIPPSLGGGGSGSAGGPAGTPVGALVPASAGTSAVRVTRVTPPATGQAAPAQAVLAVPALASIPESETPASADIPRTRLEEIVSNLWRPEYGDCQAWSRKQLAREIATEEAEREFPDDWVPERGEYWRWKEHKDRSIRAFVEKELIRQGFGDHRGRRQQW